MNPIIEIKDLVKYFDTNAGVVHALDHVDLRINQGETFGIVGESGCGKTTLGRCSVNLVPPTSGQVLYRGRDIFTCSKSEKKQLKKEMQIIFQDPYASLDPRNTVFSIIAEAIKVHKAYTTKSDITEQVESIMDTVGLARRLSDTYPHELDGGRRQRIGIARALVLNPEFVVCDEPVSALDVSIQAQILNLMMDIQEERGLSYMFITHDLSVVKHISNSIAVMYLGEVVEYSPTEELFQHPCHPYTKALLSAIPRLDISGRHSKRDMIKGEVSSPIDPKPGCRFTPRCSHASDACASENIPLKEVSSGHFLRCCLF